MTATTENNTPSEGKEILFIDFHVPNLPSGDYTLNVTQKINFSENDFRCSLNFSISGPRFTLDPQEIQSVFPPEGSLGDHSNVLPHIILKRSTLPWERNLLPKGQEKEGLPWLALLLFEEGEFSYERSTENSTEEENLNSLSLKELKKTLTAQIKWPGIISLEAGQQESDRVSVINVSWEVLKDIIPTGEDLKYLTHVRKSGEDELAVIIGNRLPASGVMSTVHLVSLEGRYYKNKEKIEFDDRGVRDSDLIRLVSLKSWRFACLDHKQSFKGLLTHLNHQFLFNIQKEEKIINYLNNKAINNETINNKDIPDILKTAFQQNNHSLDESSSVEHGKWQITDQNRIYFISSASNVYNQVRKFLFQLPKQPQIGQENKVDETTGEAFSKNKHVLSKKATIDKIQSQNFWWLNTKYFITLQNDILYVYYLDPDRSSTLRLLPLKSNNTLHHSVAEEYMKMGCVPLPHAMRQGNKTVSWYRGPLVPGRNQTNNISLSIRFADESSLAIRSADELVSYNSQYGMFDADGATTIAQR